ncbi:CD332 [Mytilus edulis]|uniref:FGFR2 n=1 Tax=Mytilus edulis TaxID=6550 RepID=A0A8S3RM60_MYTED|nr:CD332 [Mytilus edulis]
MEERVIIQIDAVVQLDTKGYLWRRASISRDEYSYTCDATHMTTPDITWTNQGKFNILEFYLKASLDDSYVFPFNQSVVPSYISKAKFGIVSASASVIHKKLRNSGYYVANRTKLSCPNLSTRNPITDLSCLLNTSYIIQFDSGDRYMVHFTVGSGGYRSLLNGQNYYRQNNYTAIKTENSMQLHFDYEDPIHCSNDSSCTPREVPFRLSHDVTNITLSPSWYGWKDKLSGVSRYVFEVWKMEYSYDYNGLREPLITTAFNPVPLFIKEVNATGSIHFPSYEPRDPGVYSTILEVNDRANNSKYARQVAIFDKTSNISTSSANLIVVTTASPSSNFTWQTSQFLKIEVSWSGHFMNEVHEKGHFLAKILDYEPRLDDGKQGRRHDYKKILPRFDDNDGVRNKSFIPNIKSIIRFETVGRHYDPLLQFPKTGWEDVVPLNDNKSFPLSDIRDGDSYQLWIRAHDIMGNNRVDSTVVHFDRSKPIVHPLKVEYNIDDGEYPFSSRVRVAAEDEHSGVRKISFRFIVNGTGEEKAKQDFLIESKIGMVKHLHGIQQCKLNIDGNMNLKHYSPSNITVVRRTSSSVSIKWIQAKTCYERAGIVIILYRPDNKTKEFKVHKDADTFDLTGLSRFIVVLIVVIVVLVFLGRTGRLQPAKQRITAGIRTVRNTIRVRATSNAYNNRAYISKEDDDIYFYGGMDMKEDTMKISRKNISLESELARGRFAVIFLAKYYTKTECHDVVAKTIKDDQNEEAIMKMKAKINFYTKKVGRHKNVLEFIGSVEDEVRGPMMILEYCSKGVLKQFLEAIKSNISVDIDERLSRMVFGICLGMDFLASKQVVHRRLAARNILLNDMYEPKITGFGPDPSSAEGDDDKSGNERIPIKWVAPECMKSTQNANELSDVWSFGIVMWEIFSLGETPYPGLQSREVPGKIKQGYKMKKPEYCDDTFFKVMLKCWHYDPRKRSGFEQLKEQMNNMFTEAPGDDYYYRTNDL